MQMMEDIIIIIIIIILSSIKNQVKHKISIKQLNTNEIQRHTPYDQDEQEKVEHISVNRTGINQYCHERTFLPREAGQSPSQLSGLSTHCPAVPACFSLRCLEKTAPAAPRALPKKGAV